MVQVALACHSCRVVSSMLVPRHTVQRTVCCCTFGQRLARGLGGERLVQVPLVLTPAAAPRRAVATMAACVSESSIQPPPSNKGKSLPAHLSHRDELINILAPPEHRRFSIEPALLEPNSEHDICGEGGLDALVLPSSPSGATTIAAAITEIPSTSVTACRFFSAIVARA